LSAPITTRPLSARWNTRYTISTGTIVITTAANSAPKSIEYPAVPANAAIPWVSTYFRWSGFSATGSRNWFQSPTKFRIASVEIAGRAIGTMIEKKVRHSPAPSIAAASVTEVGSARKNGTMKNTVNGSANAE
jgi:hypothetical protein